MNTSNLANNLTTTSSGYALDARQGKTLNNTLTDIKEKVDRNGVLVYLNGSTNEGWKEFEVQSLSNFKYIVFVINDKNMSLFPPAIYPLDLFKTCSHSSRTAMLSEWDGVKHYAYYVSDTKIGLYVGTTTNRAIVVYGIK